MFGNSHRLAHVHMNKCVLLLTIAQQSAKAFKVTAVNPSHLLLPCSCVLLLEQTEKNVSSLHEHVLQFTAREHYLQNTSS